MTFTEVLQALLQILIDYLNEETLQDWQYDPSSATFQLITNFQSQLPNETQPDPKIRLKIVADSTDRFKYVVESSHSPINEAERIKIGNKLKEANDTAYKSLRIFNDFLGDNIIYYYVVLVPKEVLSSPDVARVDMRLGPFIRTVANQAVNDKEIIDEAIKQFASIRTLVSAGHAIITGVTRSKKINVEYVEGNTEPFA